MAVDWPTWVHNWRHLSVTQTYRLIVVQEILISIGELSTCLMNVNRGVSKWNGLTEIESRIVVARCPHITGQVYCMW